MISWPRRTGALNAALTLIVATTAGAVDVPDMTGRWAGQTHTIVAGTGGHFPESKGTFENPYLVEKEVVYDFKGQADRRFWGVVTLVGADGKQTSEPFIGQLTGSDYRTLIMIDADGYYHGTLADGKFTYCYTHTGGQSQTSVIGCQEVTRLPEGPK